MPVSVSTELDESRFVGMQRQSESREALAQFGEEALGLLAMFESTTKSSAKRTATMSPCASRILHRWTQRSNT